MKDFRTGFAIGLFVVLLWLSLMGTVACMDAGKEVMAFIYALSASWDLFILYKLLWEKPKCRS